MLMLMLHFNKLKMHRFYIGLFIIHLNKYYCTISFISSHLKKYISMGEGNESGLTKCLEDQIN